MATEKQIVANRQNALKSTGPRSLVGKERSSQNAIKHGLTAHLILPGEDPQEYMRHCGQVEKALRPKGRVEAELARRIADLQWRMRRLPVYEKTLLQLEAYLQAVEHDGINDDYEPGRNVQADELAGTDADLIDPLRLGRVIDSLLERGAFDKLSRYERGMQRDLVSALKLLHEVQVVRHTAPAPQRTVDVRVVDDWFETPDGRILAKAAPP